MFLCEVVENKFAFKTGMKDPDTGDTLPIGTIQIRIGSHESNLGQVRNLMARPCIFQNRIPHIGEIVYVVSGPSNDWSTSKVKNSGFFYFSPVNSTDDAVIHRFPRIWKRKASISNGGAERKNDKEENYTFPEVPDSLDRLQPFEGDDLWQGRSGQSIRFGTTVKGDLSVYEKKPSWDGSKNADPIMLLTVKKPKGDGKKYEIEDIDQDESSIYLTSNQSLSKLKAGFDKNTDAKQIGQKMIAQIVLNSKRVVINAADDSLFLIGKEKTIVTGKEIILQTENYKVNLDDLMDWLKDWIGEDTKLAQGQSQYSTAAGPTATATSVAQYVQLNTTKFQKFKMP